MTTSVEVSVEVANNALKTFYPDLLEVLPITDLVSHFYSHHLLSARHKANLDALANVEDKSKYFLDKVLTPGVRIGYTEQFDEMLRVMKRSDDGAVKFLAVKIEKVLLPPETSPVTTSPVITPTVDPGRYTY